MLLAQTAIQSIHPGTTLSVAGLVLGESGLGLAGALPAVIGVIAGLLLWAAGGKLLKAGVILTGLMVGGVVGFLLGSLAGTGGALIGLLIGLVAGGIASAVFYRFAVGLTFGVGCGLAAAVVGLAIASGGRATPAVALDDPDDQPNGIGGAEQPIVTPPGVPSYVPDLPEEVAPGSEGPSPNDVEEPATAPNPKTVKPAAKPTKVAAKPVKMQTTKQVAKKPKVDDDFPGGPASPDGPATTAPTAVTQPKVTTPAREPQIARASSSRAAARNVLYLDEPATAGSFMDRLSGDMRAWWSNTGSLGRSWAIGAGLLGLAAGSLLGILMPGKAAGLLTAATGAAIWMPSSLVLAHAASLSWPRAGMLSPMAWVMVWVAITLVGLALQVGVFGGGKKSKPARAASAATGKGTTRK